MFENWFHFYHVTKSLRGKPDCHHGLVRSRSVHVHLFLALCGYEKIYRPISKHWCEHRKNNVFHPYKWIVHFFTNRSWRNYVNINGLDSKIVMWIWWYPGACVDIINVVTSNSSLRRYKRMCVLVSFPTTLKLPKLLQCLTLEIAKFLLTTGGYQCLHNW